MRCTCHHHDPRNWLDEITFDRRRLRTICKHCKRFIGYRPRPADDATKPLRTYTRKDPTR